MATGAVTAREPKVDTKLEETTETAAQQPLTLKQRFVRLLHDIFQGREEYLGWRH